MCIDFEFSVFKVVIWLFKFDYLEHTWHIWPIHLDLSFRINICSTRSFDNIDRSDNIFYACWNTCPTNRFIHPYKYTYMAIQGVRPEHKWWVTVFNSWYFGDISVICNHPLIRMCVSFIMSFGLTWYHVCGPNVTARYRYTESSLFRI